MPTDPVGCAVDLGCGPGNSTELLAARWPEAEVAGLDSSPDMVAAARARLPGIAFDRADIAAWDDPAVQRDLANAVLQWLPDHERLLPSLVGRLAPGGSLAVQVPDNLDEPSHRLMREVGGGRGRGTARIGERRRRCARPRQPPEWYARLLHGPTKYVNVLLKATIDQSPIGCLKTTGRENRGAVQGCRGVRRLPSRIGYNIHHCSAHRPYLRKPPLISQFRKLLMPYSLRNQQTN